jgi:hypothetical protein
VPVWPTTSGSHEMWQTTFSVLKFEKIRDYTYIHDTTQKVNIATVVPLYCNGPMGNRRKFSL